MIVVATTTKTQGAHDRSVGPGRPTWSTAALQNSLSTGRGVLFLPRHASLLLLGVLVLVVGSLVASDTRYGLILSTIYAIAVLGNNAIASILGELSLGAGPSIAVGAYVTAYSIAHGVPVLLAIALAGVAAGLVGALVAIPTIRLRGVSTALVTFALAYSIPDLVNYLEPVTGGDQGMYVPADVEIAGLNITGSGFGMLLLAVLVMVAASLVHIRLFHGHVGRRLLTVGEAEQAAAVFGTPTTAMKVAVWGWAALLGGLCGALSALSVGYLTSTQWQASLSIFILAGGLIGGSRSASGAWIGGMLVGGLPIWLQNVVSPTATPAVYGVVLLLALLTGGRGLSAFVERGALWPLMSSRRNR